MAEKNAREIKQRIFNTAVKLFARKSYGLVGVREIAADAGVSISMISYHFGGKAGILEAIIEKYFGLFTTMFNAAVRDDHSFEQNVRRFFHGFVDLIRSERDLSLVWHSELNNEIPEVSDIKYRHLLEMGADANRLLGKIGLDITRDVETVNIIGSAMIQMIYSHFTSGRLLDQQNETIEFDDEFYDRYAAILADLCLNGIKGVFTVNETAT
ncbi:MAG: TetR/AcrR family transcriptional regulator [Candidatus Neomarinimicrobiota bacterium]